MIEYVKHDLKADTLLRRLTRYSCDTRRCFGTGVGARKGRRVLFSKVVCTLLVKRTSRSNCAQPQCAELPETLLVGVHAPAMSRNQRYAPHGADFLSSFFFLSDAVIAPPLPDATSNGIVRKGYRGTRTMCPRGTRGGGGGDEGGAAMMMDPMVTGTF